MSYFYGVEKEEETKEVQDDKLESKSSYLICYPYLQADRDTQPTTVLTGYPFGLLSYKITEKTIISIDSIFALNYIDADTSKYDHTISVLLEATDTSNNIKKVKVVDIDLSTKTQLHMSYRRCIKIDHIFQPKDFLSNFTNIAYFHFLLRHKSGTVLRRSIVLQYSIWNGEL